MTRILVVASLLLLAACPKKADTKTGAQTTTPAQQARPADNSASTTPTNSCTRDLDCGPKQLCIRNQCVDISSDLAECTSVRVFFPLNSSEMSQDSTTGLERSARCLKADHALHVTIEGNADERGTEEYNLALGDRRATTVAKYLERLGASSAQLKTVSYGKENPLCVEHDEECWGKNRRADLAAGKSGKKK